MNDLRRPRISNDMKREVRDAFGRVYARAHLVGRPTEIAMLWCFVLTAAEALAELIGVAGVVVALRTAADKLESKG